MQQPSMSLAYRALATATAIAIAVSCSSSDPPSTGQTAGTDGGATESDASTTDDGGAEQDSAPPADHKIDVTNYVYTPKKLTVKVGQTVEWVFKTGTHTVTSGAGCKKDGAFDSGVHKSPFTFRHTFDAAGTFEYFCDYMEHCAKGQVGTITVE